MSRSIGDEVRPRGSCETTLDRPTMPASSARKTAIEMSSARVFAVSRRDAASRTPPRHGAARPSQTRVRHEVDSLTKAAHSSAVSDS